MARRWWCASLLPALLTAQFARAQETSPPPAQPHLARLSLRLGPSFGAYQSQNQFAIGLDGSIAVTPDRRGSIFFAPQVELNANLTTVMLPFGFEYAFPVGTFGLSIYARLSIGYLAQVFNFNGDKLVNHAGVVIPEAGVRWCFKRHYQVGLEPFSLPIFFDSSSAGLDYRIMAFGGVELPWDNPPGRAVLCQDGGGNRPPQQGDNDPAKQPAQPPCPSLVIHRPISQFDDEPPVDDADHGAYTLRNDDADYEIGASPPGNPHFIVDALPITTLQTDLDVDHNPDENDLVHIEVKNPGQMQNVYLFAFELNAEDSIELGRPVNWKKGDPVKPTELKLWLDAQKNARAPSDFPIAVGNSLDVWVEGLLGGRYRIVLGQLQQPGTQGAETYDLDAHAATPKLNCETQTQLTVVVVDLFQQAGDETRLNAFDVYWSGKPYFKAQAWPPSGKYTWAVNYKRGKRPLAVPGTADNNVVGYMLRLGGAADEQEPTSGTPEVKPGRRVTAQGTATAGNKAEFDGGLDVIEPTVAPAGGGFPSPRVTATRVDRYASRISAQYEVEGETLVRIEPLELILPRLDVPAASPSAGGEAGASSTVQYQINDHLQLPTPRRIRAHSVKGYVELYGAGLKAWEALAPGTGAGPTAEGVSKKRPADGILLDVLTLSLPNGNTFDLRTAQRSQAEVTDDRMTVGAFEDTLRFFFNDTPNGLANLLNLISGTQRAARNQESITRSTDYRRNATDPAQTRSDATRAASDEVCNIPQDVILQLRVGTQRKDLRVLTENHLTLIAPYFYTPMRKRLDPTNPMRALANDDTFLFHMRYALGGDTNPVLVPANYRRRGGVDQNNAPVPP